MAQSFLDYLNTMNVGGIVLAAGFSSRMGVFKPIMSLGGETFVASVARKLIPHCRRVVIVTGHRDLDVRNALQDFVSRGEVEFVHNSNFAAGMFSSLQAGMRALGDAEWLLCHWVDQPNIPESFYAQFVQECDPLCDVIQPEHSGRRGHPLLIGKRLTKQIIAQDSNSSLRKMLDEPGVVRKVWPCVYPQVLQDFDSLEDIAEL